MGNDNLQHCKGSQDCHAKNHMCQIIIQKDMGRVKELVKGALFYCKNCGRAARPKENLCNPSRI